MAQEERTDTIELFSIEERWKNFGFFTIFFGIGFLIPAHDLQVIFLLLTLTLSQVMARPWPDDCHFIDKKRLLEFNCNYKYCYYHSLMLALYVFVAFKESHLITLDIIIVLYRFIRISYVWFILFFIPVDGELPIREFFIAKVGMVVSGIMVLALFSWLITFAKGFFWVSDVIVKPFNAILYLF